MAIIIGDNGNNDIMANYNTDEIFAYGGDDTINPGSHNLLW